MIYLSSNSGELFKQVLLLNPLDMFALANLLCPSLALPPFRARPRRSFSIPFPPRIRVSQRSGERRMDGWMPEETLRKLHGDGGACFMAPIECASTGKIPLFPLRILFSHR